jgi:hypothetical protein
MEVEESPFTLKSSLKVCGFAAIREVAFLYDEGNKKEHRLCEDP